jgi:acyl transferase domain-containing protein
MSAPYEAPLLRISAALEQAARHCGFSPTALHEEILGETADAILAGAARLARDVLSPLNRRRRHHRRGLPRRLAEILRGWLAGTGSACGLGRPGAAHADVGGDH